MNAFVYGTLLFPQIAIPVANLQGDGEAVTLTGFRRYEAKTRERGNYPAIVADDKASVDGLLFRDITNAQLEQLDEFEGVDFGLYLRQTANVELAGETLEVGIYVAGPALYERLLEPLHRSWSPVLFAKNELQWYVENQLG